MKRVFDNRIFLTTPNAEIFAHFTKTDRTQL